MGSEGNSNMLYGTGAGNILGNDDDFATFMGYRAGYNTTDGTGIEGKYNTFVDHQQEVCTLRRTLTIIDSTRKKAILNPGRSITSIPICYQAKNEASCSQKPLFKLTLFLMDNGNFLSKRPILYPRNRTVVSAKA